MANPLRWFRRHEKLMMVFFGIGLMAVFGLGSVVSMINPSDLGSGGRENPVYAQWKGGEIKRTDLDALRFRHFQTIRFLQALQSYAADKKGDNFQSLAIPIQPVAQGQNYQPERVDEELLSRFLLAQKAEEEGLVVGDGMIEDYLALVAGNVPVSRAEMSAINKEVNQGQAGLEAVKRQLKIELAAQQMSNFAMAGIPIIPNPMDAIELYTKTSRRVECQVLPISVDPDSIKEEPTASEVRKIFDEGNNDYPDPQGIRPGFKIGKRINVQYLVANRETFLQNEMNKLTDAEVQAEYERLVEAESPIVMELIPDDNINMPSLDDPNEAGDDDAAPTAEGDSKNGESSNDEPGKNDDPSAATEDNDAAPAPASPDEKSGGGLSTTLTPVRSQYVSTSVQEPVEETAEETAEEIAASLPDATGEIPQDEPEANQNETKVAEQDEKGSKAADEDGPLPTQEPMLTEQSPDAGADDKKVQSDPPLLPNLQAEKLEPEKQKMRPKPLIDCARQVKESLKGEATTLAINEVLSRAEAKLGAYRSEFTRWKYGDVATRSKEPAPVDSKAIADEFGLEFRESGLVDEIQLEETEIGKIRVFRQVMGPNGRPQGTILLLGQIIFDGYHDANEYDPKRENDMMVGSTYLYWLSEKAEARVPNLDEVKDEVVEFWKKQKAFDKALQEAEQIASSLNEKPGETLIGKYPEKAIQTGEFTWFNTASNRPAISAPIGVTQPGDEFMKTVFSLDQYDAAATFNYVRDNVYVVQMMTEKATVAETGKDYLENRYFKFKTIPNDVRSVSQWYGQEINIDWNEEFTKSMDLEFIGQ